MEMKTIVYRGGVLKFRIPASWQEEYSDMDGGMFYEDGPDTGTLRVKVITIEAPAEVDTISLNKVLEALLQQRKGSVYDVRHIGQNAVMRYQEPSVENGTRITIFYWVFVNPILPRNARVVTFSHTVLGPQAKTPEVLRELEMLDNEIIRTEFALQLGVVG
jgi:hypothetical protein